MKVLKLTNGITAVQELCRVLENRTLDSNTHSVLTWNANVCGGFARWACSPRIDSPLPADIDIFPASEEDYETLNFICTNVMNLVRTNEIAVTFQIRHGFLKEQKVQLIKPPTEKTDTAITLSESIHEVIEQFDFSICRVGFPLYSGEMFPGDDVQVFYGYPVGDDDFEHDEEHQVIRLVHSHCPISSLARAIKYVKKGYNLPIHKMVDFFVDWDTRTKEYQEKLKENMRKIGDMIEGEGDKMSDEEFWEMERLLWID